MEFGNDTKVRNSIWKRLSRNISESKIGEFARAVNRVFSSVKSCRKGKGDRVPTSLSSAFVYPEDRFLSNKEILRQLEVLERRFNQQTNILRKAQGKEVHYKKAESYHGDISPDIQPDRLSFLVATLRPARYTEQRFAELEKLVEQVKERRKMLDSDASNKLLKDAAAY